MDDGSIGGRRDGWINDWMGWEDGWVGGWVGRLVRAWVMFNTIENGVCALKTFAILLITSGSVAI